MSQYIDLIVLPKISQNHVETKPSKSGGGPTKVAGLSVKDSQWAKFGLTFGLPGCTTQNLQNGGPFQKFYMMSTPILGEMIQFE